MAVADDSDTGPGGSSWDTIAAVDGETGEVTYLDRHGVETGDPLETGIEELQYVLGEGPQLAIVANDAAGVVDVAAGTVEAPELPEGGHAVRVSTSEPLVLAAGEDGDGEITIISATTSLDVAELAGLDDPRMMASGVRSDHSGTLFAVADINTLETAVVGTELDEPVVLPGLPLGITEDVAVTTHFEGELEVRFFTLGGELVGTVEVPAARAGLVTDDGDAILVTEEGAVLRAAPGDEEADSVTTLDPPGDLVGGQPALGGRRLLVVADRGVVVLDDRGEVVTTLDLGEPWLRQPLVNNPAQRCVVVLSESGMATMLDLETGETLGTIDEVEFVGAQSTDGCVATGFREADDATLMRQGAEVSLEAEETVVSIAPTGDFVVVRDGNQEFWLRDLDGETEDVALGGGYVLYAFVDR